MADTIEIKIRRTSAASDESNTSDDAFDSLGSSGTPPSSIGSSPTKPVRKRTISTGGSGDPVLRTSTRTIYTAGRPPWYNSQGQLHNAFVIGLCGGSASGKTTVANEIIKALDVPWVSLLSMDSFYKVLSHKQHEQANRNEYNFDHPDAFDFDLLVETLKKLKEGKHVEVPLYNFTTHSREREMKTMYGANVIIFEGIMAFCKKPLIDLMDLKIFVDTDSDIRLARRLKRDITDRGRDLEGVVKQYNKFVKPAFEQFIEPSIQHADIVVPRGAENEVAMTLIVQHVHDQLTLRGFQFRSELVMAHANQPLPSTLHVVTNTVQVQGLHTFIRSELVMAHANQPLPSTLHVVTNTVQVQGLHTFIRNRETGRDEFIFYSQRLTRILIEYALSLLPFEECEVETPQNTKYKGMRFKGRICGVSILRAGEVMEPALHEVCKDIRVGKILIQTNTISEEPELHYLRLPKDIKKDYVILMDATVATGAAAMMAIRVLLDHDVPQENILFLSLLVSESGVQTVAYAFPKVKIVTTAVDKEVNENFHIIPGIGNFGDRYFGTGL